MATYTSDKAGTRSTPKGVHAGVNAVKAIYSASATLSAADIIQMVKVPQGAIVDDVVVIGASVGTVAYSAGDGGAAARFLTSTNGSTGLVSRANAGVGYQYSFSDDASVMYDTIDLTVISGAISPTDSVELIAVYHLDN